MNISLNISKFKYLLFFKRSDLVFTNLFWIGFLVYVFSFVLLTTKSVNFSLFQLFQLIALLAIFSSAVYLIKFDFENEYLKILFILFVTWSFVIFLRGFEVEFTKENRNALLFNAWFGGLIYFAPWIMLFPKKLVFYKKVFVAINLSGVVYVLLCFLFINLLMVEGKDILSQAIIEYFAKTLAISCFFILFTYKYHSIKILGISFFVIFLTFIFGAYRARRGLLFMIALGMFFLFVINFINSENKFRFFVISVLFLVFSVLITFGVIILLDLELFQMLEERGVEDTRATVERYFFRDMDGWDWVIGRGMFGEYFCPTGDVAGGPYRGTIETDYLNMILKGGAINLVLLFLILIPAIVLGIFFSKNTLALAFGFWILFWSINTYPSTVQVFSLTYLLVWVGVGICYSRFMRNIPESVLIKYFRN